MNISAVITAGVFVLVSVCALILLFVGKIPFANGAYRTFYRACCGIYISGTVLVLVFTLLLKALPVMFVVISNVTILAVFVFTVLLIYFTTKKLLVISEKAEKAENKNGEDEIKESKESKEE